MTPAPDANMSGTYDTLAAELRDRLGELGENDQFWLAIAGPPGAGKSTLSRALTDRLGASAIIIPMDGYHYYRAELDRMPDPGKAHHRRGAPFTFNVEKFVHELSKARETRRGAFPSFDHGIGDPIENDIDLDAAIHRLVIVEGNYLSLQEQPWCRLRQLFDETWFIDANFAAIRRRVMDRFLAAGLTAQAARRRVETNDIPNAELVIVQSRSRADRIIRSI